MTGSGRNRDLERRLRDLRAPDEDEVEARALDVVRSAYADHHPLRPSRATRRIALGVGCGAVALAIGLSPAGARVGDLVSDAFSPSSGAPDAKPALRSLPAPGQLLVESDQGPWVVQADGSKRLLGDYRGAGWSPHGRFVAAIDGRQLVALDPGGEIRWTVTAPAPVASPQWSPCCDTPFPDYRIAYLSGTDLRVVDADGSDDRLLARDVAPVAPAWRQVDDGELHRHVLTWLDQLKHTHSVDVDTGETLESTPRDVDPLFAATAAGRAISPDGTTVASIESRHGRDRLVVGERILFAAPSKLTGPTWSPDGRWLLVGWPQADQWLFIPVDRGSDVVAVDRIAEQFDPGAEIPGRFPRVAGWAPVPPPG